MLLEFHNITSTLPYHFAKVSDSGLPIWIFVQSYHHSIMHLMFSNYRDSIVHKESSACKRCCVHVQYFLNTLLVATVCLSLVRVISLLLRFIQNILFSNRNQMKIVELFRLIARGRKKRKKTVNLFISHGFIFRCTNQRTAFNSKTEHSNKGLAGNGVVLLKSPITSTAIRYISYLGFCGARDSICEYFIDWPLGYSFRVGKLLIFWIYFTNHYDKSSGYGSANRSFELNEQY